MTQSTLSASIKELESILQVALVDRSKRRVVLTPVGVEAVERARKIVKEIDELVNFTSASRDPLSGTLRMGAIPTIGPFLLPRVLPGLRKAYSRLKLYLVEDLTDRLVDLLHRGELDIVLLALPYDCGPVEAFILFEDPFVVGLPGEHPLARAERIKPQQLWQQDLLLLKDGHCLREHALQACHLADRSVTESFEATSLATLVQMVDNGLGTTLLPTLAVDAGLLAWNKSGHAADAGRCAGAEDRTRLAARHGAAQRVPAARERAYGASQGGTQSQGATIAADESLAGSREGTSVNATGSGMERATDQEDICS